MYCYNIGIHIHLYAFPRHLYALPIHLDALLFVLYALPIYLSYLMIIYDHHMGSSFIPLSRVTAPVTGEPLPGYGGTGSPANPNRYLFRTVRTLGQAWLGIKKYV